MDDAAGGGGGGAGGSVVLCAPDIALGGQINLAGGTFGNGVSALPGTAGQNGRLAIYSKSTPTGTASITATRFDNVTTIYPAALTLEGEPRPVIVSMSMVLANQSGGYIATIVGKGTPGASYILEKSTDLTTWTQDGSPRTAPADGLMTIVRTANPGLVNKLYYRLRKL